MALGELRRAAREQLLADAHQHTRQYRTVGSIPLTAYQVGVSGPNPYVAGAHGAGTLGAGTLGAGTHATGAHGAGAHGASSNGAGAYLAGQHRASVGDDAGCCDRPAVSAGDAPPIVLTGHQPQLFHPGVWFKNFVLAAHARRLAAPAVNLIIDNDTIRAAAIRVPRGPGLLGDDPESGSASDGENAGWVAMVEFDRAGDEVPFEERAVLDPDRFRDFPRAVRARLSPELREPLVESLWPVACAALADTDRLGLCVSRARNVIESQAGLDVLDVPLSVVCDGWPFRWFAVGLLEDGERFREIHNAVLAEYRRLHRIRSRSHPVPELARDGDWCEAPFWLWTRAAPRRRRLFARRAGGRLELTDRAGWRCALDRPGDGDASRAVEQLEEARRHGVKLRPRALLTTLFARLLLGDQFVHGIGGAKYDQLTDALLERFCGVAPPAFITATATVRLPLAARSSRSVSARHAAEQAATEQAAAGMLADGERIVDRGRGEAYLADSRQVLERLRALRYHPELLLSAGELADEHIAKLVAEKRYWLALDAPRGQRLARHRALGAVNELLYGVVRHREAGLLRELAAARRDERRRAMLRSREFSYALFPKKWLMLRLLELASPRS